MNKKKFLTITNQGSKPITGAGNQDGLWPLKLDCWRNLGNEKYSHLGRLIVNSGQPWAQYFRDLPHEVVGQYEPIPEGRYTPGPLEFASGWKIWSGNFPEIQSPIWCVIHRARAIGFHFDGNRTTSPGSAACPVFRSLPDCHTFTDWWEDDPFMMTSVWVEYVGVGGRTLPPGLVIP